VAEEHNSEHIISLSRFRMPDLTSPSAKDTAALLTGRSRSLQRCPALISFRHYTSDDGEMSAHAMANA